MKLDKLLKSINAEEIIGKTDIEIENICADSRLVTKNSLFICLNGVDVDGHTFIRQAEFYGACAVVCEKQLDTALTQIIVKDSRSVMSELASVFFGLADKKLSVIGVVGTNGKTSTARIIYEILNKCDVKTALIGTLGTFYGKKFIEPTLTTPDPIELHKQFKEMVDNGIKVVVMEVSAHALYFDKIKGINFTAGVFTNFSQDHLDFFKNMEEYKSAKLKFFKEYDCKYVITNSDDEVGREISKISKNSISYGIENPADVFAIDIDEKLDGTNFVINLFDMIYNVNINLIGRFNVYNVMAAATTATLLGFKSDKIIKSINTIKSVSGRLEKVYDGKFSVFIDYAHTPDGLKKALMSLKNICRGRLFCVFGCGGNRDKGKRKKMGRISGEISDFSIITTDNPRYEEPMDIISEIEKGMLEVSKQYVLVQDRTDAIEYALKKVKENDMILIAGKGCENYQEILGIKRMYNDKDTVEELIRSNGL